MIDVGFYNPYFDIEERKVKYLKKFFPYSGRKYSYKSILKVIRSKFVLIKSHSGIHKK